MNLIRAFPRRTRATPIDKNVRIGFPHMWDKPDEVHISVAFSWDLEKARVMYREWDRVAGSVKIGGPAIGSRGEDFTPGMYVKDGYTITSRGCPNKCWFCDVWKRDGDIRELPIKDGWNVLDDNILATSKEHFNAVCKMLERQPIRPEFTGGLEAARLTYWHAEKLYSLKPKQLFFAYDTADDLDPLRKAEKVLVDVGFTKASHKLRCYVLCGYPRDSHEKAESRMLDTMDAGFFPMAMLYRDKKGIKRPGWTSFQREWARPHIVGAKKAARPQGAGVDVGCDEWRER